MIVDTSGPEREAFARTFGACIIGTGPAGITLARRLAAAGIEVALMEGGALDFTTQSQATYDGALRGLDYYALDVARLRYFGGSSNLWNGSVRALDPHDFTPRAYQPFSGWPIAKADLDPYEAEASRILNLDGLPYAPDPERKQPRTDLRRFLYSRSRPATRFGEKYHDELQASETIHLGINANLVDLRLDDAAGTLTAARFRSFTPEDPGFAVAARSYILCTGGIENPRILLNARSQMPQGIGNGYGLVGRFFAEHPDVRFGEMLFREPFYAQEHYSPTPAFMAEKEILNFNVNVRVGPGVITPQSLRELPRELVRELACRTPFGARLGQYVSDGEINCDPDQKVGITGYFARRRTPEALLGSAELQMEQVLDPENRVQLLPETDALGLNRPVLTWRLQDIDRRTVRQAMLSFGVMLAEEDLGRLRVRDWLLEDDWQAGVDAGDILGSFHHMCTTRMSADPRQGVVDRDCRVHGMSNLYVGGSSVFATAGHATPTYTIVQLALRLGDHLAAAALAAGPASATDGASTAKGG
jgi:choline dehydrogenase-like flavoprotein